MIQYCLCGCGLEVKQISKYYVRKYAHAWNYEKPFPRTTPIWNKGLTKETDARIKRHSQIMTGKLKTEETKEKLRKALIGKNKGKKLTIEQIEKMKINLKGKHLGNTHGFKKGQHAWNYKLPKEQQPRYGKPATIEARKKSSISNKILWEDPNYREWRIKIALKHLFKKPSGFEEKIINIINKNNLPYKYVGDGSFLIGYKNPDFINVNGEKMAIEVYHSWFKIRDYGSEENYKKQRQELFSKYGWKTIFINENELNNEEEVLKKLL